MAERIQRKRTRGWKAPEGAVYVGRPTRYGNPYRVPGNGSRQQCVDLYRKWLEVHGCITDGPTKYVSIEGIRNNLRGKDLMCWCRLDQPCHADVLLELANKTG